MSTQRKEGQHYARMRHCLERARIALATVTPAARARHHFEGWLLLARSWRDKARAARAARIARADRTLVRARARALVPWTHHDSPFMDVVFVDPAKPWSCRD